MNESDQDIDCQIMETIKQGKQEGLAQLYDRHNQWLFALAYRTLQNKSDAEDLLHDVFLEIWRKAASYNIKRGSVVSWLAVKMRSRALDRYRSLKALKERPIEKNVNEQITNESMGAAIDQIQANKMLSQLTPRQRNAIELCYFKGFTCQEISQHSRMPIGTVKSDLVRAIQALRQACNIKEEIDYANR